MALTIKYSCYFNKTNHIPFCFLQLGNILVRPTPNENDLEMVLLDVGLITELSPSDWENFKALFKCIVAGDGKKGAELMITRARQVNISQNEKGILIYRLFFFLTLFCLLCG